MILCLDIGNSHIYGGVFKQDDLRLQFRIATKAGTSSDEYGLFLRSVLRENGIDPEQIDSIALCSVVPEVLYPMNSCCLKYFSINPLILQAGVKTGLKIEYQNPQEVGADRIANAIAGSRLFAGENLIIIDLGTATTFCAIGADRSYRGGVILPGLRLSMQALQDGASKLGSVEIVEPWQCLGKNTTESIQSGLYHGHLGAMREIIEQLKKEQFEGQPVRIIGTGGFTALFQPSGIYDEIIPDLVLQGLKIALQLNQQ